ncbi:ATP-binding protein [Ideonella sp. YS5]|uniref:ATP-binding protein n=1 Tax=Ideonella sp. YS5 TaxID=3453714 RepID=UPI003EE96E9C
MRAPRNWRRFDTLGLRLFVLMWLVLVGSHVVAYWLAVPALPEGAQGGRQVPTLGSLPPGGPMGGTRPQAGPADGPGGLGAPGPDADAPDGAVGPPPGAMEPPPDGGPGGGELPSSVLWLDYGIRALVIALGAALGARWLAAPMKRLSRAAGTLSEGLPQGATPPTLDERHGTHEVREAAAAFNRMAGRLQEQFDLRGLHMAGVSHDLRTPLTRLRMRLESFEGPQAEAAVSDIREMDGLIDSSLSVLREQRDGAPAAVIDLVALVQARVDDLAAAGHDVALGGMRAARARAHPAALGRIVDNLIGNALRYGGRARVAIVPQGARVELTVDDDGPGIPPDQIELAFQPWVRLGEEAPGARTARGGQGLGLAIARDLAERDGGSLTLVNRAEGGLRARLVLPAP